MTADDKIDGGNRRYFIWARFIFWPMTAWSVLWFLLPVLVPVWVANNSPFPSHALSGLYKIENGLYEPMRNMTDRFGLALLPDLKSALSSDDKQKVFISLNLIAIYRGDASHLSEDIQKYKQKWAATDRSYMFDYALLVIGEDVEELKLLLKDPDPDRRLMAIQALNELGPIAKSAYPDVLAMDTSGIHGLTLVEFYRPLLKKMESYQ